MRIGRRGNVSPRASARMASDALRHTSVAPRAERGHGDIRGASTSSERTDRDPSQLIHRMPEFEFDPPLTLKGNIVVRTLDDAVWFMIAHEALTPSS